MSDIIIRSAAIDDLSEIVALFHLDEFAVDAGREISNDLEAHKAAFDDIRRQGNSDILVAERDGMVIGAFQLTINTYLYDGGKKAARIVNLHVHPDHRRKGIGAQMVEHAVTLAQEAGCELIELFSHKGRVDAHRFYERLGFVASHFGMRRYF